MEVMIKPQLNGEGNNYEPIMATVTPSKESRYTMFQSKAARAVQNMCVSCGCHSLRTKERSCFGRAELRFSSNCCHEVLDKLQWQDKVTGLGNGVSFLALPANCLPSRAGVAVSICTESFKKIGEGNRVHCGYTTLVRVGM